MVNLNITSADYSKITNLRLPNGDRPTLKYMQDGPYGQYTYSLGIQSGVINGIKEEQLDDLASMSLDDIIEYFKPYLEGGSGNGKIFSDAHKSNYPHTLKSITKIRNEVLLRRKINKNKKITEGVKNRSKELLTSHN